MALFGQKKDLHTAEDYRTAALSFRARMRHSILTFLKTGAFAISAITIAALSLAWFASMNTNTASGLNVELKASADYELGSELGGPGIHAQLLQELVGEINPQDNIIIQGDKHIYSTSDSAPSIVWMLTPDSHIENIEAESELFPGSSGHISFYIIPSEAAPGGNITLCIELTPYELINVAGRRELRVLDIPELDEFFLGHIQFFKSMDNDGYYVDRIEPLNEGTARRYFSVNVQPGEMQEFTVYWIWPMILENFQDRGMNFCRVPIGQEENDFTKLLDDINTHPERYFVLEGTEVPEPFNIDLYPSGHEAYNAADDIIGTSASFLGVKLSIIER